jgi:hypothetical protein
MGYCYVVTVWSPLLLLFSGKLGPDNSGCWGQFRLSRFRDILNRMNRSTEARERTARGPYSLLPVSAKTAALELYSIMPHASGKALLVVISGAGVHSMPHSMSKPRASRKKS